MPNILDLLRNPIQDEQGQPDYPATAVDLNAQSLPAPMSVGAIPTPSPLPQNAILGQPGASERAPAAPLADTSSLVKDAIAKKYGYSQAADDAALQDAMQLQGTNQLYANMGGALNTITHAISGRQGQADNSFFDKLGAQSGDQMRNVLALRKGEQDSQAFSRQQELADPSGVKAAILRKQLAPIAQKVGIDPSSLSGFSVQDLKEFATQPLEFAARLKSQEEQHRDSVAMQQAARQDSNDLKKIMLQNTMSEKKTAHDEKMSQLEVPGFQRTGGIVQIPAEAQKAREAVGSLKTLESSLDQMDQLVKKYGSFEYGGEGGAQMESLATTIQMELKNLYTLGALSGPDMALLQSQIKEPGSVKSLLTRDSTARASLQATKSNLHNNVINQMKSKGYEPVGDAGGNPVEAEMRRRGLIK